MLKDLSSIFFASLLLCACGSSEVVTTCGEGTVLVDNTCVNAQGSADLSCGQGTVEFDGECIASEIPAQCSPNPCAEINRTRCTVESDAPICLCDIGYVDDGGDCRAVDAGPIVNITQRPNKIALGAPVFVASWADGRPLVGTKGAVVALGWWLNPSDTLLVGNWEELLGNAVVYAASQGQ